MKTIINNFLIWLNTPRCIDIPIGGKSPDAELYDDFYKQKKRLEENASDIFKRALDHVYSAHLIQHGYLQSPQQAVREAREIYENAKENGFINEFNELVRPKENF